jgi:electron transfer flavoprotein alpha subunit
LSDGRILMVLVIAEQRDGKLNRATWEAVAAAQQLAAGGPVCILVPGAGVDAVARELGVADVQEIVTVDAPALEPYTPDGFTAALTQAIGELAPSVVLLPHTYQTRDFAPKLAARLDRAIVTDVTAFKTAGGSAAFVRPMFQGKLTADVVPQGETPHFVTVQIGAFRADQAAKREGTPAPIRALAVTIDAGAIREKPEAPFQEARQAVDLSQAERIVAVGRGIKEQDKLPVAQQLAEALHAELAASRPICDAGWLPMARQVGSSGQTVAPKLYLALGISGAIQHLVGMKGSQTIAAINKDPDAPIFEVADYGIVGDLFEIVPAIIDALKQP